MEKKGIVLPELSCRTAAELLPPDFSVPEGHPPESFGGSSAPGVHRQSCQTGGRTASTAARLLRRCRRSFGGSRAAPARGARRQSLLLHAVVQSDSSLVNGQQLICIKATNIRNSAF